MHPADASSPDARARARERTFTHVPRSKITRSASARKMLEKLRARTCVRARVCCVRDDRGILLLTRNTSCGDNHSRCYSLAFIFYILRDEWPTLKDTFFIHYRWKRFSDHRGNKVSLDPTNSSEYNFLDSTNRCTLYVILYVTDQSSKLLVSIEFFSTYDTRCSTIPSVFMIH